MANSDPTASSSTSAGAAPGATGPEPVTLEPHIHVGLEPSPGEEHPICMVNGRFARTGDVDISPSAHGLHYGTNCIGGTGGWHDPATGQRWAFRLLDTVQRLIANGQAIGLPGPFPDPMLVVKWFLTLMGLNLSALVKSQDIYCRPLMVADGVRLGVGSVSLGTILGITRDLTDYLPTSGISLLFPGMLFRRPNPFMGVPTAKSEANYALSHLWKTRIAPRHGCQEVLALSWNGHEVSETTGSVPIGIRYGTKKGRKPTMYVPRPKAWRLNSITTETVIWLARHMGWEVKICEMQVETLACCHEIWLLGTWTGPGPVTELKLDPNFLRGEPPVPTEVFWDGIGTRYADWLAQNFHPVSAKRLGWAFSTEPGIAGCGLRDAYWAVVRHPAGLADLGLEHVIGQIPPDWRIKIPPRVAEARVAEASLGYEMP